MLNLLQQGMSNLAIINHFTTQEMELTLEQVCYLQGSKGGILLSLASHAEQPP